MVSVILSSSIRGVISLKVRVERITGAGKSMSCYSRAVNYLVIINNFFFRIYILSFFR